MVAEKVINKVVITEEAVFDYEETVAGLAMPKADIKLESESYIDNMQKSGRLLYGYYFRAKYYDEQSNKMLLLFFYKGIKMGRMQMWKLSGICEEKDWTRELEDDGQIRAWLNTAVIDLPNEPDWVVEYQVREEERQRLREDYCD